jgi:U3 small nucleolar RNA-associated protein 20
MDDHRAALHEYLLVEFVLTLLYSGVTKGTLGGRSPEALGRLDPLLPLLVRALHCRHSASVSLALRTLAALVALPLPTLRTAAPAAGKAVAALLKRAPSLAHPVAQDSFRLLAGACLPAAAAAVRSCAQPHFRGRPLVLLAWA